jgi:hypothetical protein
MKPHNPVVLLAAATLGAAACLGDEKYHVEQRQFAPEAPTKPRRMDFDLVRYAGYVELFR